MKGESTIASRFQSLKDNYGAQEVDAYIDYLQQQPVEQVIEHAEYVFIEPLRGASFLTSVISNNLISESQLSYFVGKIGKYHQNCIANSYQNHSHLNQLIECMNVAASKLSNMNSDSYIMESTRSYFENLVTSYESSYRVTLTESLGDMGGTYIEEHLESDPKYLELKFSSQLVNTLFTLEESINMESLKPLIQTMYKYEAVQEGIVTKTARKVALKGEKMTRQAAHGIRKNAGEIRRVKVVTKRIPQHIDSLINATLGRVSRADKEERRKRILERGFRVRLMKIIRNAVLIGGAALIHPALAVVSIIGSVAVDRHLDVKVRRELLRDLQTELDITKEKINDARSGNERQNKYELMRIQKRLENEITRVQYHLEK